MNSLLVLGLWLLSGVAMSMESSIRTDTGAMTYATHGLASRRGELVPPPVVTDLEEMNHALFSDLKVQHQDLKKVKYYLLNGDVRMARAHLAKMRFTKTSLRPVIYRYLGILSFIESNFEKSFEYLSAPELQVIPHFSKICIMKVLSEIVLNKTHDLENDWPKCQVENARNFKSASVLWLETLVQMKLRPRKGQSVVPFRVFNLQSMSIEETKTFLKLALFLTQEKLVVDQLANMDLEQLKDPEVRELAGQIYFRTGSLAQSYKFIEDLQSPNSENIKGNLYLLRNKYELAYAQFKVALGIKQNSQNAMERLLPLAWLLGDWEGGTTYAEMVIASPRTRINKLTLLAAFLMQKGEYEKAAKITDKITLNSLKGGQLELTQISTFASLMQNKIETARKQASLSCEQYDIVNCWILFQLGQWDSFPLTMRREEALPEKNEWQKLAATEINSPLKENVYIDQIDIEEMDDKLIQLIPSK